VNCKGECTFEPIEQGKDEVGWQQHRIQDVQDAVGCQYVGCANRGAVDSHAVAIFNKRHVQPIGSLYLK